MSKTNPLRRVTENSGGLWWDHDDPGVDGTQGLDGLIGAPGSHRNGGDTPQGYKLVLPPDTTHLTQF